MLPEYELVEAVKKGNLEGMKEALSKGATLDARDIDGSTLLEVAQKAEKHEAARLLIKLGCDIEQATDKGDTLLHKAVRQGDIGFTGILLEHGADKYATNKTGKTPMDYAKPGTYLRQSFSR